jgi:hypothetical protein
MLFKVALAYNRVAGQQRLDDHASYPLITVYLALIKF